jgi:ribosomal-protein-alanine N-acetyltransferase
VAQAVTLRPLRPADAPALAALLRRNRANFQPTEPLRDDRWYEVACQRRVIERDELVGRVALGGILRGVFLNAYLGYAIDAAHSGRGIATAAVSRAVALAWEDGLHRVQAAVSPANVASQRVLEKVGFRREGFAERYLLLAGRWTDQQLWAITTEDELRPVAAVSARPAS